MDTSVPNVNFLARLGDMRGSQNKKVGASKSYATSEQLGAADFRIRPLTDKFLYRGLVRVNAYKCAKFQVPSSISYGDMEGVPE